jgi:hypothetical protein
VKEALHQVARIKARWRSDAPQVCFTLSQARSALPYVAQIAHDASRAFADVQIARSAIAEVLAAQQRVEMVIMRDSALRRLNSAIDDCNAVGADLIDLPHGIVRFNAQIEGRFVSLMWRLGDNVSSAWTSLLD